jgi:hypothetical protein
MLGLKPVDEGSNGSNLPTGRGRESTERPKRERERDRKTERTEAIEAPIDCKELRDPAAPVSARMCAFRARKQGAERSKVSLVVGGEPMLRYSWYPVRGVRARPGPENCHESGIRASRGVTRRHGIEVGSKKSRQAGSQLAWRLAIQLNK